MPLHLDIPTQQQLTALLAARATPSVSLYLPTGHLPHDEAVARIELKNLAHQALTQVEEAGLPAAELREHLDDLHDDEEFWRTQAISLAVFATAAGVRTFRLPNRLTTLVEVSDRYHLKPLLRSVTFPQAAFVLALAQGSVRLVEVAAEVPAEEVRISDLPGDVASAVGKASITDRSAVGRIQGSEGQKVRMRQYARQVDAALRPALGASGVPLILASAEPLESIYRSVNSYPFLAPQTIQGNPETATAAELAEEARAVLDGLYAEELERPAPAVRPARLAGARGGRDHRHRAGGDVRRRADAHGGHGRCRLRVRRRGVGRGDDRRGRRRDELRHRRRDRPQGHRARRPGARPAPRRHPGRRHGGGDPALPVSRRRTSTSTPSRIRSSPQRELRVGWVGAVEDARVDHRLQRREAFAVDDAPQRVDVAAHRLVRVAAASRKFASTSAMSITCSRT